MENKLKQEYKLIAEFLGAKVEIGYENKNSGYIDYTCKGSIIIKWREQGLQTYGFEESMLLQNCKFYTSWDWIMLVIEKIESIELENTSFAVNIRKEAITIFSYYNYDDSCKFIIDDKAIPENNLKAKLETLYEVILKFINWYNNKINE